ncbi:hypothetical protein QUA43_30820 [Microcoleus sp. N9_B4]|uniref:hypothetical protein n=1 Tax=Microcoleus sp. N9_B4 TaxID=3055386 RepID=UPI002FCF3D52
MTIPLVVQGLVEIEKSGKVFELDSSKGSAWLESIGSFRFEPVGDNKPYTVRKEAGKGGDYWYGYRKQNGKLHKKYIGKSSEINTAKLEEIAEALNTPPQPRVTDKVTETTEKNTLGVTYIAKDGLYVTPRIENFDRLTALELQVQALQESLEALRSELPGKFAEGDSSELPNLDAVTDNELQIELGNLRAENEALSQELAKEKDNYGTLVTISQQLNRQQEEARADYAKLLESSTHITNKLRQELAEVRSQLATERADREEIEAQLSDLKQNSVAASKDLPEAADLLNQLKAKRKKSRADLADIEAILEMIEKSCDDTSQGD